jgi:hypothetical protein
MGDLSHVSPFVGICIKFDTKCSNFMHIVQHLLMNYTHFNTIHGPLLIDLLTFHWHYTRLFERFL